LNIFSFYTKQSSDIYPSFVFEGDDSDFYVKLKRFWTDLRRRKTIKIYIIYSKTALSYIVRKTKYIIRQYLIVYSQIEHSDKISPI
jgi:hypothetical protein